MSELLWAPDGRQLIFNLHGALYRVLPGNPPERLGSKSTATDTAASPGANAIAYLSGSDLWVVRFGGGTPVAIRVYAPGRNDVGVESFSWSRDGKRIAIIEADTSRVAVRRIPDYLVDETRLVPIKRAFPGEASAARRLGIVPVDGGAPTWVELGTDPLDEISSISWSPDSGTLLVDKSDLYIKVRRLLVVEANSGHTHLLREERDPGNVTAEWWSDWASNGRGVFFVSDRDNDYHVYFEPLSGGEPMRITTGDFADFSATVSPAAKSLFVVTNAGKPEERQAYRVPLQGGATERLTLAAGTHGTAVSPEGRFIADIFSDDVTPPDLYLLTVHGRPQPTAARRVTHSPLPEFARFHWVAAKYVEFPNDADGTVLHARLTLPPDFDPTRKYPAILGSVYSNTVHNQ